ncbi:MAG: translesion DNA synthesis-associated protein ImuA [Proteobacteria bacterium]|nr:translesion DNA synthesis-associated protein ImuA [Pseudomonadota bacterium]
MADSSENSVNLDTLPGVWRGRMSRLVSGNEIISTGFNKLDEVLPGGGWPLGCLTEILSRRSGSGELTLLLPAMAQLSRQNRWVSWIAPPHIPYAPTLAAAGIRLSRMLVIRPRRIPDLLWSAEQALRHGNRSAVLIWLEACNVRTLRRLQLAASEGGSLGVIFRSQRHAATPSPAALRMKVGGSSGEFVVDMFKCRGGRTVNGLRLSDMMVSGSVPGEQVRSGEHAFTNL